MKAKKSLGQNFLKDFNILSKIVEQGKISEKDISKLEIPTGNPLLIEFENKSVKNARYLDKERAQDLINF